VTRAVSTNFLQEKNQPTNKPIWLYQINISDTPEVSGEKDLYFCRWHTKIKFPLGDPNEKTYIPWDITHSPLKQNVDGKIDSVKITASNISREMQFYLEQRDGLRGRYIIIKMVFEDHLDDPDAVIEAVYYIDSCSYSEGQVVFRATSKLDLLETKLPRRIYMRDFCHHVYKGRGCWIDNGDGTYSAPSGFSSQYIGVLLQEFSNQGNPAVAPARFHPVSVPGLDKATDSLVVDLMADDPTNLAVNGAIEITSSGGPFTNRWVHSNLSNIGITTNWKTFTFPISGLTEDAGPVDTSAINYFRWWNDAVSGSVKIHWRNVRFLVVTPYNWIEDFDSCDHSFANCKLHGNTRRFGGFPNIPYGRVFRVRGW